MWDLYLDYEVEMKMDEAFQAAQEFIAQFPKLAPGTPSIANPTTAKIAYIESLSRTDVVTVDYELSGSRAANGVTTVNMITLRQGWAAE